MTLAAKVLTYILQNAAFHQDLQGLFCFVCVDVLHPSHQFLSHVKTFPSTKQRIEFLAEGHNTVPPVSLQPVTPRPHV